MADVVSGRIVGEYGQGGREAPGWHGAPGTAQRMAESVTRHAEITGEKEYQVLASGVDSLDVGIYVDWGAGGIGLEECLDDLKTRAQGTEGVSCEGLLAQPCLVLPAGKSSGYKYHLLAGDCHLFLASMGSDSKPRLGTPNAYASLGCRSLWTKGIRQAVGDSCQLIDDLGGKVVGVKPSRCDLCVDLEMTENLSLEFLRDHRVSQSNSTKHFERNGQLESYYVGSRSGAIQARIYDKGREVLRGGTKEWFFEIWGTSPPARIWRVEFQLRRRALKQFGIQSVDELLGKLGGVWAYLCETWLSFRLPDHENVSRRTVLGWWQVVQRSARLFGGSLDVQRELETGQTASPRWYVSHVAGCLVAFAARLGLRNLEEGLECLSASVRKYFAGRDYDERYVVKRMKLSLPLGEAGEGHERQGDV